MWEFLSLAMLLGGGLLAAPHAIPAYQNYLREAKEERERQNEIKSQERAALPEDRRRQEEVKELMHRRVIAEEKVKTLVAESKAEAAEEALQAARENGLLAEMGMKSLALPAPSKSSTSHSSTESTANPASNNGATVSQQVFEENPLRATPTMRRVVGR